MSPTKKPAHTSNEVGSVLITVLIVSVAALAIIAAVLQYAGTDLRDSHQQLLRLQAKYAAESVLEYGNAQAAQILRYNKSLSSTVDLSTISLPAGAFTGTYTDETNTGDDTKLAVKMYYDRANQLITIDRTSPENANDPQSGMRVFSSTLSVVARGNARDPSTGRIVTNYLYEQIQVRAVPLLNYAIFYNPMMELSAGADFSIVGPVHSNRRMSFDPYQSTAVFRFHSRITTADTFQLGDINVAGDTDWNSLASRMRILPADAADTEANIKTFADMYPSNPFGSTSANGTYVLDTLSNFRTKSTATFGDNFGTATHGIAKMNLPGMADYEDTPTGPNESHKMIEDSESAATIDAIASDADKAKRKAVELQKYANLSGLYIEVDYDSGTASAYKYVADSTGTVYRSNPTTGAIGKYKRQAVTLPAGVVTVQTAVGTSTGKAFFDSRRNRWIKMANVDVGKLKSAIDGTTTIANYNLDADWNGIVYVKAKQAPADTSNYPGPGIAGSTYGTGVRLVNGSQIPSRGSDNGMTIATNTAMYVQGHYNADGVLPSSVTSLRDPDSYDQNKPAAIIADAVTVLSGAWDDAKSDGYVSPSKYSGKSEYKNKATSTEISAAIITGITPTTANVAGQQSGGANNLVRFLEEWNSYSSASTSTSTLAIRGSNVILFRSTVSDAPFLGPGASAYSSLPSNITFPSASKIGVYNAGNRWWVFNKMFEQGIFPPGTPMARTFRRSVHREVTKEFFDSFSTTAATPEPGYVSTLARPL